MADDIASTAQVISFQAVSAKIPDFWQVDWLKQVDVQFRIEKTTVEQTKFDHVIQKLDSDTVKLFQALSLRGVVRLPQCGLPGRSAAVQVDGRAAFGYSEYSTHH